MEEKNLNTNQRIKVIMEEKCSLSIQDLKAISEQSEIVNKSIIEFNTSAKHLSREAMVMAYIEVISAYQKVFNIIFDIESYEQDWLSFLRNHQEWR